MQLAAGYVLQIVQRNLSGRLSMTLNRQYHSDCFPPFAFSVRPVHPWQRARLQLLGWLLLHWNLDQHHEDRGEGDDWEESLSVRMGESYWLRRFLEKTPHACCFDQKAGLSLGPGMVLLTVLPISLSCAGNRTADVLFRRHGPPHLRHDQQHHQLHHLDPV